MKSYNKQVNQLKQLKTKFFLQFKIFDEEEW